MALSQGVAKASKLIESCCLISLPLYALVAFRFINQFGDNIVPLFDYNHKQFLQDSTVSYYFCKLCNLTGRN